MVGWVEILELNDSRISQKDTGEALQLKELKAFFFFVINVILSLSQ